MQALSPEGTRIVSDIAARHGVSPEAAHALLTALQLGGGRQAQFNHPDLGGMGQWSQGGMIMIGDMFNQGLKDRVLNLCDELASFVREQPVESAQTVNLIANAANWWPAELGSPASAGSQNGMRYAYFPGPRRLAIEQGGEVRVYDCGEHRISGFAQAQRGDQTLSLTSQLGTVRVADLSFAAPSGDRTAPGAKPVADQEQPPPPRSSEAAPKPAAESSPGNPSLTNDAIFAAIEQLGALRQKDLLSEEEFSSKKRELLARL